MQETQDAILDEVVNSEYKYGFITNIEADEAPKGIDENIIRFISAKKEEPQWMLDWRLKAFVTWQKMTEPHLGKCSLS
jgi:Fe-S cluster assembly protein SufB